MSNAGAAKDRLVLSVVAVAARGGPTVGFGVVVSEAFGDVRLTDKYNPDGDININEAFMLIARGDLQQGACFGAEVNCADSNRIIWRGDAGSDGPNLIIGNISAIDSTHATPGLSGARVVEKISTVPVPEACDNISAEAIVGGDDSDGRLVDAADCTTRRDSLGAPFGALPNDPAGQRELSPGSNRFGSQRKRSER